jgi:hypothetical protein
VLQRHAARAVGEGDVDDGDERDDQEQKEKRGDQCRDRRLGPGVGRRLEKTAA